MWPEISFSDPQRIMSLIMMPLLALVLAVSPNVRPAHAIPPAYSTIVVNSTDPGINWFSSSCSLREAILNANNHDAGSTFLGECQAGDGSIGSIIKFSPATFDSGATISLTLGTGDLPEITANFTTIDGWSAGGDGYTGPPLVTIDGAGLTNPAGDVSGLTLQSDGNKVRGLALTNFSPTVDWGYGIIVGGQNNKIQGNYVGLAADGISIEANDDGIVIFNTASGTVIGTDSDGTNDVAERNVISGNDYSGVWAGEDTIIRGNFIGVDASGLVAAGNDSGVLIPGAVILGGESEVERNVISGNRASGVILHKYQRARAEVRGNYIGTDSTGLVALPNTTGIELWADEHLVPGQIIERNLISGNLAAGIDIKSCSSPPCTYPTGDHLIRSNIIGLGADETTLLPNDRGIVLDNSFDNAVVGNTISANVTSGLTLEGESSTGNTIRGNLIGPTSTYAPTHQFDGILLVGAGGNRIVDNLIGGNSAQIKLTTEAGISGSPDGNIIEHNRIGSDPDGNEVGGSVSGLFIWAGSANLIADNDIRFQSGNGIVLRSTADAMIFRNRLSFIDGSAISLDDSATIVPDSTQNCIEDVDMGLFNSTGVNVNFENNWWGAAGGPSESGVDLVGPVDYTPWLTTRPLCGFDGDLFADGFESGDVLTWSTNSP